MRDSTKHDSPRHAVGCEAAWPTIVAPDVKAAVDHYRDVLGFDVDFIYGEPPMHAGVRLGNASMHISRGEVALGSSWIYFVVDDADELYAMQKQRGADVDQPPENRPYNLRDYRAKDLNGYTLMFGQPIPAREPPLEIERVDVHVRLEKRLAALLEDLAKHKQLSISETLEETLLHTFEKYKGGVASPHTEGTLRYIEKLKTKHGIDYETHDSYRFREKSDA